MVSGRIGQLFTGLSKIIILVEGLGSTALVCQKHKDMEMGPEELEGLMLKRG
jgi:hypothetical protein